MQRHHSLIFLYLIFSLTLAPSLCAEEKPLIVKAWMKTGSPKPRETRVLSHLKDFNATKQPRLNPFGGWDKGPRYEATGFFYTKKVGDRWWMVDPTGRRFLHIAVNSVSLRLSPTVKKNYNTKYGSMEKWRDATLDLLTETGFNGTGRWTDDETLASGKQRIVYSRTMSFMGSYAHKRGGTHQVAGHLGYDNNCIFAFDQEFEKFSFDYAKSLASAKEDPYLLGIFSDNEMPLFKGTVDKFLALDKNDPGQKAAAAWMLKQKGSLSAKLSEEDHEAWREHVTDRYLDVVRRAIRSVDPNHIFLGPRFYGADKRSPGIMRAAGKHLDAVAINIYGVWTPTEDMRKMSGWAHKPIIPTEWYAKGADSGMANLSGAGWTVPTQADRGRFYQNFTLGLLESKVCVGWHWFKYMDNDPLDRGADPSNLNSNKGMVRTNFEPYTPLLVLMKELNVSAYPLTTYFDANN